ncbi:hypothetical protein DdX_12089 [Ditylenchus destructor]|uniref:Uncharacterized protein n=1 Tax=Ditylenchus destructor TaxID=166010 RepID=A0AAD4MYF0_9BILA|nr:hypothetical protein DdX_12089 [Ditylenchus destructor]
MWNKSVASWTSSQPATTGKNLLHDHLSFATTRWTIGSANSIGLIGANCRTFARFSVTLIWRPRNKLSVIEIAFCMPSSSVN